MDVKHRWRDYRTEGGARPVADFIAGRSLLDRVETVHRSVGIRMLALSGGVAANSELRRTLSEWGEARRVRVLLPERAFTTDNAAMIAFAGLLHYRKNGAEEPAVAVARSRWPLGTS